MNIQVVVKKRHGETRPGRGFSRGELREAGWDLQEALRLHLPVDARRKTKHKENVKSLKQHLRKRS